MESIGESLERELGTRLAREASHDQSRVELLKLVTLINAGAAAGSLALIGTIIARSASGLFPVELFWPLIAFGFGLGLGTAGYFCEARRTRMLAGLDLNTAMKKDPERPKTWVSTMAFAGAQREIDDWRDRSSRAIQVAGIAAITGFLIGLAALWSRVG